MIKRLNYTGRIKIPRSRMNISLHTDKDGKYFHAGIDLAGFDFPPDAKIYIEGYFKGVYQRFSFGTVARFQEPAHTRLNELPETELVYFDVSVVDEHATVGLLLGRAKGIVINGNGDSNNRFPLLPVNPADLKHRFWKLSFDSGDDGSPVLEINKNLPDFSEMAKNDIKFICLVYPAAFRGVLERLIQRGNFDEEEDTWDDRWVRFINIVLGIKTLPETDDEDHEFTPEQETWMDDCVNEYCKKLNLFEKFTTL